MVTTNRCYTKNMEKTFKKMLILMNPSQLRTMTLYEKEGLKNVKNKASSQIYFEKTFPNTAQKIKFSIKDFFSKLDQIHNFLCFAVK